jgi:hypothetical protein
MRYTQQEYYENGGVHYAQGWALVHMLRESKRLEDKWERILPEYLANLLQARHEVATELMAKAKSKDKTGSASEDPKDYYEVASTDAIQALAYEKTFSDWTDEDWEDFDAFYLEYVEKL